MEKVLQELGIDGQGQTSNNDNNWVCGAGNYKEMKGKEMSSLFINITTPALKNSGASAYKVITYYLFIIIIIIINYMKHGGNLSY